MSAKRKAAPTLTDILDMIPEEKVPKDLDAERAVLGAILVEDKNIIKAREAVKEDDFFTPGHRAIFRTMLILANKGSAIDLGTAA